MTTKMRKRLLAAGAIAATAALFTGCAGGDSAETVDEPTSEETAAQTEDAVEESPVAEEPSDDVTAPGTTLAIGDTAVLQHPIDGEEGETALLAATVTEIEAGTVDELAELELGEQAEGLLPFYLHISVGGVDDSSEALAGALLSNAFNGMNAGSPVSNLNIIGSWDRCDTSSLDSSWAADSTQEICIIALAPEDGTVDAVQYAPRDEAYRADPVVWES